MHVYDSTANFSTLFPNICDWLSYGQQNQFNALFVTILEFVSAPAPTLRWKFDVSQFVVDEIGQFVNWCQNYTATDILCPVTRTLSLSFSVWENANHAQKICHGDWHAQNCSFTHTFDWQASLRTPHHYDKTDKEENRTILLRFHFKNRKLKVREAEKSFSTKCKWFFFFLEHIYNDISIRLLMLMYISFLFMMNEDWLSRCFMIRSIFGYNANRSVRARAWASTWEIAEKTSNLFFRSFHLHEDIILRLPTAAATGYDQIS